MSLRKDMTINESVFRQNINSGPSIVIYHLSYLFYQRMDYLYFRKWKFENLQYNGFLPLHGTTTYNDNIHHNTF